MSDRDSFRSRLEEVHDFPCEFLIKVIGENDEAFVTRVIQAAVNAIGADAEPDVDTRESSGGRHISVSLTITAHGPDVVLDVYAILNEVEGVRFLM